MKPVSASSFGHAWLAEPWLARRKARLRLRLRAALHSFRERRLVRLLGYVSNSVRCSDP